MKTNVFRVGRSLAVVLLAIVSATAAAQNRDILVMTSTNDPSGNEVVVFKLSTWGTPSLSFVNALPTGGVGGASGNAGIVQFGNNYGAVANYGSNTVTQLVRNGDFISIGQTIKLASGCTNPDSVALTQNHLFAVGVNCAESHVWPWGSLDGRVSITDSSAAQIVAGQTWAAVTLKSGSVLELPLSWTGALKGTSSTVTLPSNANNTPLGAAFWGDLLGFTPAHSPDSFALVDKNMDVYPVLGPQPPFPSNAPCWVAKGAGNIWYTGNTPGTAVSIFFTDGQGGTFYKSVLLPGGPTDLSVSRDGQWLAVIYTATDGSGGRIAVFSIDSYGDLTLAATSPPVGFTSFNGVAFSQ